MGMDAETLKRAVEPFFSTKGVGKGTGLGLSMVDGLASQLGGALRITSQVGLGTKVDMYLPIAASAASHEAVSAQPMDHVASTGKILLVDDDAPARASTKELLLDLGYKVEEASSGREALRMLEKLAEVSAVISDHLMPGMTGSELVGTIAERWAGLPVLLISGYADLESISPELPRLAKPFRRDQLRQELTALGV
jgi:CheY-like chemotaxis protein